MASRTRPFSTAKLKASRPPRSSGGEARLRRVGLAIRVRQRLTKSRPPWDGDLSFVVGSTARVGLAAEHIVVEVKLALDVQPTLLRAVVALATVRGEHDCIVSVCLDPTKVISTCRRPCRHGQRARHERAHPGPVVSVCLETLVEHRGGRWRRCRCANGVPETCPLLFCGRTVEADKVVDVLVVMVRPMPTNWKVLKGGRGAPRAIHRQGCRCASDVLHDSVEIVDVPQVQYTGKFADVPVVLLRQTRPIQTVQ